MRAKLCLSSFCTEPPPTSEADINTLWLKETEALTAVASSKPYLVDVGLQIVGITHIKPILEFGLFKLFFLSLVQGVDNLALGILDPFSDGSRYNARPLLLRLWHLTGLNAE